MTEFVTFSEYTVKDTDDTYYCNKNQVRWLCVGGDIAILSWNEPKNKVTISRPTHNPLT